MSDSRAAVGGHSDPFKQLIVLAYWFPPDAWSGAHRPHRFFKYLPRCGYRAHVIASAHGESIDAWVSRVPSERHVRRRHAVLSRMSGWVERLLPYGQESHWIPHAIARAQSLLARGGCSIVLSTSPPNATHLAALWLKRRHGLRWVADLRDPIYGNPFHETRYAKWYDRALERQVVSSADAIIANTDLALKTLHSRYPEQASKLKVIWNGFDPEERLEALPLPKRDRKVLLHAGSIYGGRHPGTLLDAMDRLVRRGELRREDLLVRLIGWIDRNESWVTKHDLDRLVREGWVECVDRMLPKQEAQTEMATADGLLLLDLNEQGAGLQMPAKLFEYVMIGRPILAVTSRGSATESVLKGSGIRHTLIYQGEPPELTERSLLQFLEHATDPMPPSSWFEATFNGINQTESLADVLDALPPQRGRATSQVPRRAANRRS